MMSERYKRANENANPEHKAFVKKNLDLVEQVVHLLNQKGWTQKTLAQKLDKSESEISKWLSGLHNFTFQTVVKLEQVLGSPILVTPVKYHQTVVKEVQRKFVDELIKQVNSSSFMLKNQVLAPRVVTTHNWYHASPVSTKTTLNKSVPKHKAEEQTLPQLPLQAA